MSSPPFRHARDATCVICSQAKKVDETANGCVEWEHELTTHYPPMLRVVVVVVVAVVVVVVVVYAIHFRQTRGTVVDVKSYGVMPTHSWVVETAWQLAQAHWQQRRGVADLNPNSAFFEKRHFLGL